MSSLLIRWLARTPVQTFVLCPMLVVAFELVRQGKELAVVPAGVALLAWGYLQYLLVGRLRGRLGGGGPGLGVPPERIVVTLFAVRTIWFHRRVLEDEARLRSMFGAPYLDYQQRVKRWIPGLL
jgi:hypothetical protein